MKLWCEKLGDYCDDENCGKECPIKKPKPPEKFKDIHTPAGYIDEKKEKINQILDYLKAGGEIQ